MNSPQPSSDKPQTVSLLYAVGWGVLLFVLTAGILIFSNADLDLNEPGLTYSAKQKINAELKKLWLD